MDKLELQLKELAYYGGDSDLISVEIENVVDLKSLSPLGKGLNTRVFKIGDTGWVLKEGRWDLDANLFKNLNISLPTGPTESVLNKFELYFLPNQEEIKRQYGLYLDMVEYYGYFKKEGSYYHPNLGVIFREQELLRKTFLKFLDSVCKEFGIDSLQSQLSELLTEDLLETNFLPKEYLLFGKSFSEENKGKDTYFIFQEMFQGRMLHDISIDQVDHKTKNRLVLLGYILLLMSITKELVPDLRPRYFVTEGYDWFFNTDNIMVSDTEVKFIDTRWMWNMKDNVVKRGIIIPELTIESTKKFLIDILKNDRK